MQLDNRVKGVLLIAIGIAIIAAGVVLLTLKQELNLLFFLGMGFGAFLVRGGVLSLFPTFGKSRRLGKNSRRNQ